MLGLLTPLLLAGCGYNDFQRLDEQVKARLGRGAEPIPAPSRLDPQYRQHGQGRSQLRAGNADQGDRGSFPPNLTAMIFSYPVKPTFTVQNEAAISAPPAVNFDKPAAPAAAVSK
ncbi:MAG TPA: hypothetical protein VET87_13735 [Rubrivivax sp.]|nr:hypothetical protein [Rubrivivax sp.]